MSKRHWFKRWFKGGSKELSILEEEQMQSPFRTVVGKFCSNKLSMFGLIVFLCIFLIVFIAPNFIVLDLGYQDSTQINMAPGFNLMSMPEALKGKVADISVSSTYSIGVDTEGKVYVWGQPKISKTINMADIPEEVKNAKIVKVAAGIDHAIAIDEEGNIYGWGNNRNKQLKYPKDLEEGGIKIVELVAGYQSSAVVDDQGNVYAWGNTNLNDISVPKDLQGNMQKVVLTGDALLGLTKDGKVEYLGKKNTAYSKIPEGLDSGVKDIAASSAAVAALKEDGSVVVWGNTGRGLTEVPQTESPIVSVFGARYHFDAICEDGSVVAWGQNGFGQANVPSSLNGKKVTHIFTGYFQNYAMTEDGQITTWGLSGYLMGTDGLGRDVFVRLINGGRMTMTIGAVAVIISTFIGIVVGCISGYFGGKVDMFLQRVTEIVSSLPFLPFALILSAIIGSSIPEEQRIMLIMVVLGVLSWTSLERLVRAQVLAEREKEFVTAARAMGVRELGIVFRHILPNVISVIIVSATLDFATCMLTESSLSYLGFGVSPPQPTWGNMLYGANNSTVIQQYWWQWLFPSIALGLCTICINLIGDGLRDAIDPKSNDR